MERRLNCEEWKVISIVGWKYFVQITDFSRLIVTSFCTNYKLCFSSSLSLIVVRLWEVNASKWARERERNRKKKEIKQKTMCTILLSYKLIQPSLPIHIYTHMYMSIDWSRWPMCEREREEEEEEESKGMKEKRWRQTDKYNVIVWSVFVCQAFRRSNWTQSNEWHVRSKVHNCMHENWKHCFIRSNYSSSSSYSSPRFSIRLVYIMMVNTKMLFCCIRTNVTALGDSLDEEES